MAFENIGKLKIHLAGGGSLAGAEGCDAVLTLIDELETLRGQFEAQKLLVADLVAAAAKRSES